MWRNSLRSFSIYFSLYNTHTFIIKLNVNIKTQQSEKFIIKTKTRRRKKRCRRRLAVFFLLIFRTRLPLVFQMFILKTLDSRLRWEIMTYIMVTVECIIQQLYQTIISVKKKVKSFMRLIVNMLFRKCFVNRTESQVVFLLLLLLLLYVWKRLAGEYEVFLLLSNAQL